MADYDSRPDTWLHIHRVRELLQQAITDLLHRSHVHDQSKLVEPELSIFNEYTPKLANSTYGSATYKSFLIGMGEGLAHHYRHNRHHPEHWESGVHGMSLIDLLEMLIDWKAATERHADGNIHRSIHINADRFHYSPELITFFLNTARDFGWTLDDTWMDDQ